MNESFGGRHNLVNLVLVLVLVLGTYAFWSMPRAQYPEVRLNWVAVATVWPGVSSHDVERSITLPLEAAVRRISGVRYVGATSRDHVSTLLIRFDDLPYHPVFDEIKGVEGVESGYAGGGTANPTYREVCSGTTGHAEVVQVHFDPNVVSYRDLLNVFFAIHDPTTLNRQGADVGTQYRSAIFYHYDDQKMIAEEFIESLNAQKIWDNPIVTQLAPLDKFYMAEDYHQEYFARNPYQPYCMAVVAPKVSKFRKHFLEMLKKEAA